MRKTADTVRNAVQPTDLGRDRVSCDLHCRQLLTRVRRQRPDVSLEWQNVDYLGVGDCNVR